MPDLHAQVERLLTSSMTDSELEQAMWTLVRTDESEFARFDGTWALRLYERSPYIFARLITYVISKQEHLSVLEELLRRAEADDHPQIFRPLYAKVASRERWNTDVMLLVNTAPNYEAIVRGLEWRNGDWAIIGEDVLVALYRHDPAAFGKYLGNDLLRRGRGHYFHQLPPGRLEFFRRELARHEAGSPLYNMLFRRYATRTEWLAEVVRLLHERPKNIAHELQARHPDDPNADFDADLLDQLVTTFGEAVMSYLNQFSSIFIRRRFAALLQSETDDTELLHRLQSFTQLGNRFRALTPEWTLALYERNPDVFADFILWHADHNLDAVKAVLARARRDGRYDFYRQLFAPRAREADWNADLADVLQSETANLPRELDRLDIQKERRGRWQNAALTDENAAALYRRGPFQEFIWRYLMAGSRDYDQLVAAVHETGDTDFELRLLRKVASPTTWRQEMKRLLEQDIPPEHILDELEKRRPVNTTQINPSILADFMAKYGDAVLPFFENYLDWTAPNRLNRLLDLNIENGVLLRELQAIARRQPAEFTRRAGIWALRLYERSPEFFSTFIVQHLNSWDSQDVAGDLLRRMEADGRDKLFRELYSRVYRQEAWQQDIARLLRAGLDDEALSAALMRRSIRRSFLPDDLAAELYERNPVQFLELITAHIGRNVYGAKRIYDRLRKAAEKNGDTALVNAIDEYRDPAMHWQRQMSALLERDVPPDRIVSELERLLPRDHWGIQDFSILAKFVEKYGDVVLPFLLGERLRHTNARSDAAIRQAVERYASKANFWRFMFIHQKPATYWKAALEQLADSPVSESEFRRELAYLTPDDSEVWQRREIDASVAARLYRRYPEVMRPFVERFVRGYSPELYQLAQQDGDEDLLDFLTFKMLLAINSLVHRAFPVRNRWNQNKPDEAARQQITDMGTAAAVRFDQLYAQSPERYVRHAARVLSFVEPFQFGWGRWSKPSKHNPIWEYLTTQHHDDWRRSREGIIELMESPNIHVQLVALDILSHESTESAARVVENLAAFRALLLGDARKATRRKALACLESAARADREAANVILPLLRVAMDFNARRAIPDDITVTYARMLPEDVHAG